MARVQPGLKRSAASADATQVRHRLEQLRQDEGGFTIVESIVALMLIMMVLVGSLAMMGASVKGIVTSRQRSVATSMAREVVERTRAADYGAVGHDFDDDATLTTAVDPALGGTPLGYGGEPLVGSAVDKDPDSPFYPHLRTEALQGVTYTTWAYATQVAPSAGGDSYKRVTVIVQWGNDQYAGAVADTVRVETTLFDASEPPDPLLLAEAEVDGGTVRVLDDPQPLLADDRLRAATLFLPFARTEIESRFVRTVRSFGRTSRTEMRVNVDSGIGVSGSCTKTSGGGTSTAECPGVATDVIADNDAGTAPPVEPPALSKTDGEGRIDRGNGSISLLRGATNLATSLATAASTLSGDPDGLPYAKSTASGPASYSMPFVSGLAAGSLATFSGAVSTEVAVDRKNTGTASTISAHSKVSHPAIDLFTLTATPANVIDGSPLAYGGMVQAGAVSVAASTAAGPSADAASFTGAAFTVYLFTTDPATGAGSYVPVTVTPGDAASTSTEASFTVDGQLVTVRATLTATARFTSSDVDGTTTLRASSRLSSWLKVRLDVDPGTTRQFSYELDYGRVVVDTSYEEPA